VAPALVRVVPTLPYGFAGQSKSALESGVEHVQVLHEVEHSSQEGLVQLLDSTHQYGEQVPMMHAEGLNDAGEQWLKKDAQLQPLMLAQVSFEVAPLHVFHAVISMASKVSLPSALWKVPGNLQFGVQL